MKKLFTLLLVCLSLHAQEKTLELGIGIGTLYYPNYIGSKSYSTLTLPFPHIRYRGECFRIDEDGLSGKLLGINGLRLDLSISGSLPADSTDDNARADMPGLDLTGEIGFELIYQLFKDNPVLLELELPLRTVLSTDFTNLIYRGVISNPQLKLSLNYTHFEWTFRSGFTLANREYNSYYYSVQEQYVTPTRPYYEAEGGFGGLRNRIGMTYQKGSWWGGGFISHYSTENSVFSDSPLVETQESIYIGASIAYIFYMQD